MTASGHVSVVRRGVRTVSFPPIPADSASGCFRPLSGTRPIVRVADRYRRSLAAGSGDAELLDAQVEEFCGSYTSVPSERASASSMSTPRYRGADDSANIGNERLKNGSHQQEV